jgi:hypothetical protein
MIDAIQIPEVIRESRVWVTPCHDPAYIDEVLGALFDQITIDGFDSAPPGETALELPGLLFLQVMDGDERRGLFMFNGHEVHTMLMPEFRGRRAINAGKAALAWIWANTSFDRVTSYAYSNAPHVLLYAKLVGLRPVGVIDEGVTIHGRRVQTTRLEIRRPQ